VRSAAIFAENNSCRPVDARNSRVYEYAEGYQARVSQNSVSAFSQRLPT